MCVAFCLAASREKALKTLPVYDSLDSKDSVRFRADLELLSLTV